MKYKILNSKEKKELLEKLKQQYGIDVDKKKLDYTFIINKDNRIYIISNDIHKIISENIKIDNIGLYFGEQYKDKIRLSIEGAQIVGKEATKNIYDLNYEQMISWIKGNDITFEDTGDDFIILRYKNPKTLKYDIFGCGKYNRQTGKLMNYVSKSRRLIVVND
ncbi:MAG: hypothetical protein QXL18_04005 [Candidatus Woesearchaeota archaeon]